MKNYNTQNEKINAVSETTLVVGIDIASKTHYARAFNYRKVELSRKPFRVDNSEKGFLELLLWMQSIARKNGMTRIMVAMEPTGHYWINIGVFLQKHGVHLVLVNPHHVKSSKEMDDNSQDKNDLKDPKTIAELAADGRYMYPYIPEGVYADLRTATNMRMRLQEELTRVKNRIARWFSIYFPEYGEVYKSLEAVGGLMVIRKAPLPSDIVELGVDGINQIWRDAKLRGTGRDRAKTLVAAARRSIGFQEGPQMARMEIQNLLEDYDNYCRRMNKLMAAIAELMKHVPNAEKLLDIKGIALKTASGFIAEVGDIRRFSDPKQIQKLAGYAIVSCSSGEHKGEKMISRRGRSQLRYILYEAAISVIGHNPEFKEVHEYYTKRKEKPLKKMQSVVAVACKLIRIFYVILTRGVTYDSKKMASDIKRPEVSRQAA